MKTKYIIRSVSVLLVMLLIIPNTLSQQRGQRSERPRKEYKKSNRTSKDYTYKKRDFKRENNHKNLSNRQEANTSRKHITQQHNYKLRNNNKEVHLYNKKSQNRYWLENQNHGKTHKYYRALPNKKVHKLYHNGHAYFHCDKHFYRHYPGYGYQLVESPFMIVNRLPKRYFVKVINGHKHIIANGFYYVSYGHAFIKLPINYDNQLALSFHF